MSNAVNISRQKRIPPRKCCAAVLLKSLIFIPACAFTVRNFRNVWGCFSSWSFSVFVSWHEFDELISSELKKKVALFGTLLSCGCVSTNSMAWRKELFRHSFDRWQSYSGTQELDKISLQTRRSKYSGSKAFRTAETQTRTFRKVHALFNRHLIVRKRLSIFYTIFSVFL